MTQYFQDLFTKNEQDSRIIYKSNHQQYTLIELKTAINILAHSIKTQETSGNLWGTDHSGMREVEEKTPTS